MASICNIKKVQILLTISLRRAFFADAKLEVDDKLFPPIYIARLNHGRNVQEVAAAPTGRRRRQRTNPQRRCGNCNQPGHTKSKCHRHSPWFDRSNPNYLLFQEAYSRSIPGARQAVWGDFCAFITLLSPTYPKWAKNPLRDDTPCPIFLWKTKEHS